MKALALAALTVLLAGCGTATSSPRAADPGPPPRPTAVPAAAGPVTTRYPVTVLDDGDGPEVCLGAVAESLPPQCSGPRAVGWDWAQHAGEYDSRAGVRWGEFRIVGTFDGTDLTVTSATPYDPDAEPPPASPDPFTTPCPEPAGGWRAPEPERSGPSDFELVQHRASQTQGFVLVWLDQSVNPAWAEYERTGDVEVADRLNDPRLEIVNVQTTGDPAAMEAALREVWGGMLCVTRVAHSQAELDQVQREVGELPGVLGSGAGSVENHVELDVVLDDGTYQRWADATYGPGLVVVTSALVPAGS